MPPGIQKYIYTHRKNLKVSTRPTTTENNNGVSQLRDSEKELAEVLASILVNMVFNEIESSDEILETETDN